MQVVFRAGAPHAMTAPARAGEPGAAAVQVERWRAAFGPGADGADYEEWHENAAALWAAVDLGLPTYAMGVGGEWRTVVTRFNTRRDAPDPAEPTVVAGRLLVRDGSGRDDDGFPVAWPERGRMHAANRYAHNPAFAGLAGRGVMLGTAWDDGEARSDGTPHVYDAIAAMARVHGPDLVVKAMTDSKSHPLASIAVPDPDDREAIASAMWEAFEYGMVHAHAGPPSFLVQERVPMRSEYRTVRIGGRIVAGAGCIEKLCPPFNRSGAFDDTVEGRRGDGAERRDPDLVGRLVSAAGEAGAAMQAADPMLEDGTFDMAEMGGGRVGLIEVNPAAMFGLYAMDYLPVMAAMAETAERRWIARGR